METRTTRARIELALATAAPVILLAVYYLRWAA